MSVTYRIDSVKQRVYVTMTARVDGPELLQAQQRMAADPTFEPRFARLIDLTGVDVFNVSAEMMRSLAAQSVTTGDTRRAIVVNRTLLLGLGRMFQILNEDRPGEVGIFGDLEAAEHWLDAGFGSPPRSPGEAGGIGDRGW